MSEFLLLGEDWSKSNMAAEPQSPAPWGTEEDSTTMKMKHEEEKIVTSAHQEPSTLQWPEDRNTEKEPLLENGSVKKKSDRRSQGEGLEAERRSLLSEGGGGASRTESERELGSAHCGGGGGEKGRTGAELWEEGEEPELRRRRQGDKEEVEIEVEEDRENRLPDKAAQVFNPAVTILTSPGSDPASPRESDAFWELEAERSPFLGPQGMMGHDGYYHDWPPEEGGANKCRGCCSRDVLKLSVSVFTAALLFPFLVWGGYVFLPFDAPLLTSTPLRLVYTLRCSVFATVPILLGWLVLGVCRLRSGDVRPRCEMEVEVGGASAGGGGATLEVELHRRYVSDSLSLFLVYFLQLAVMSPYLSQSQLKLIPLLTIVFTFGRLVYWLAAALNSSVRGLGFGLSFLPSLSMMGVNLYFIFTMEARGSIYVLDGDHLHPTPPPDSRQRFWG